MEHHRVVRGIGIEHGRNHRSRVYRNSADGLQVGSGTIVQGNVVYSNSIGIAYSFGVSNSNSQLANNLVYANTNEGILLAIPYGCGSGSVLLINNTVYQPSGNGIQIADASPGVHLRNNILWVNAGYDLIVPAGSETGFLSDLRQRRLGTLQATAREFHAQAANVVANRTAEMSPKGRGQRKRLCRLLPESPPADPAGCQSR